MREIYLYQWQIGVWKMRMPIRPVLAILVCLFLASSAEAQLLKRIFGGGCPGGVCPTNQSQSWTNNDGLSRRQHTEQVHGVDTSGMSEFDVQREQNDYHNTYGAYHPVRGAVAAVASVPRAVRQAVQSNYVARSSAGYGSSGSAMRSYGSSGSAVYGYGSSGSAVGYGSSGTQYGRDYDGAPITSVGPLISQPVASGTCDCCCPDCKCNQPAEVELSAKGLGSRRDFRRELLSQAKQAQVDGAISTEELQATERLLRVPGVALMLEARANRAGAVDWVNLFKTLLPLILELIKLLSSSSEIPMAMDVPKSVYVSFPNIASTIESFEPLPLTI